MPRHLGAALIGMLLAVLIWPSAALAAETHWLATWACAVQLTEPRNLPPVFLAGSSLRQFVHSTVGGNRVRVRFSNVYGTNAVAIRSAHIALPAQSGVAAIDPASDRALTFNGASSIALAPGSDAVSDPVEFALPPLATVAVSLAFGDISGATVTGHPGSRATSYIAPGDLAAAATWPEGTNTTRWYILAGIDVLVDSAEKGVIVLGDSLTDGRGSTTDGNDRWPDDLARRLQGNPATSSIAVVNMGIGGNAIFGGLGPAAVKRFDHDVLGQHGARWVIVFEGVNDIGAARGPAIAALPARLIQAYTTFAAKAHDRHLLIYGATITPFGGSFYDSPAHESARQTVNTWIRTSTVNDGAIDFDAAVRDPNNPAHLLPAYNSGDSLHLNPAGYHAMADAIDLSLFRP